MHENFTLHICVPFFTGQGIISGSQRIALWSSCDKNVICYVMQWICLCLFCASVTPGEFIIFMKGFIPCKSGTTSLNLSDYHQKKGFILNSDIATSSHSDFHSFVFKLEIKDEIIIYCYCCG